MSAEAIGSDVFAGIHLFIFHNLSRQCSELILQCNRQDRQVDVPHLSLPFNLD